MFSVFANLTNYLDWEKPDTALEPISFRFTNFLPYKARKSDKTDTDTTRETVLHTLYQIHSKTKMFQNNFTFKH